MITHHASRITIALFALAAVAAVLPPLPVVPTYTLHTLAWDDANPPGTTYAVRVGTNSGNYFRMLFVGTNRTAVVPDLSPEAEPYYFSVIAMRGTNTSLPSNELIWPWPLTNFYRVSGVGLANVLNGPSAPVLLDTWLPAQAAQGWLNPLVSWTNNISAHQTPE